MKNYKLALILPILTVIVGCNSKNNSIEVLKANAENYKKIKNSYVYRSKSSIINLELDKDEINIGLITKDRSDDLNILECKEGKNIYSLIQIGSDNFGKHYIIKLPKDKNSIKLTCKLSNEEIFTKNLKRYK